jgi:hypothetical protein
MFEIVIREGFYMHRNFPDAEDCQHNWLQRIHRLTTNRVPIQALLTETSRAKTSLISKEIIENPTKFRDEISDSENCEYIHDSILGYSAV